MREPIKSMKCFLIFWKDLNDALRFMTALFDLIIRTTGPHDAYRPEFHFFVTLQDAHQVGILDGLYAYARLPVLMMVMIVPALVKATAQRVFGHWDRFISEVGFNSVGHRAGNAVIHLDPMLSKSQVRARSHSGH